MGKSKKKQREEQFDIQIVGNNEKLDEKKANSDFSEFSASRMQQITVNGETVVLPQSASIREQSVCCKEGADDGRGSAAVHCSDDDEQTLIRQGASAGKIIENIHPYDDSFDAELADDDEFSIDENHDTDQSTEDGMTVVEGNEYVEAKVDDDDANDGVPATNVCSVTAIERLCQIVETITATAKLLCLRAKFVPKVGSPIVDVEFYNDLDELVLRTDILSFRSGHVADVVKSKTGLSNAALETSDLAANRASDFAHASARMKDSENDSKVAGSASLVPIQTPDAHMKNTAANNGASGSGKGSDAARKHTVANNGPAGNKGTMSKPKPAADGGNGSDSQPLKPRQPVVDGIKSWADLVKTNRTPDDGVLDLDVEQGELEEEDTLPMEEDDCRESEIEKLRLVGVFSKFPGRAAVQKIVDSWPRHCNYHYHNSGWIIFCFESEDDAMEVLQRGPYLAYGGIPLTLKRMPMYFNFSKEDHSIVPIWIQLPNLPLRFWSKKGLSKICSHVGKPLHTDKMTASINAPSFARCLVDVDVSKPLREFLNIKPPKGRKFKQAILYEDIPRFCTGCKRLGHLASACKGVDQFIAPLYVPRTKKADTKKNGNNKGKKRPINAPKQAVEASGKHGARAGPVSGSSGHVSGAAGNVSKAAGHVSGAVGHIPGNSGHVSGAAEVSTGPAEGVGAAGATSNAAVAQAVAAVAQAVAAVAQSGAAATQTEDVPKATADAAWTVARGKSNKGNNFETPEKGTVKPPLMSPGTYDVYPPDKRKNNRNGKKKKRKGHG